MEFENEKFIVCLKKKKKKRKKEGPLEMVSYKAAWNVKMRCLLCMWTRWRLCSRKSDWEKKKIKKKEMKGAEMVVVPSITVVGERSWIGGLIRD